MDINRETMANILVAFNAAFQKGWDAAKSTFELYATVVPSTTASTKYPWANSTGTWREFVGERVINNLSSNVLEVVNAHYEKTIGINLDDIRDDTVGVYLPVIQQMGFDAAKLYDKIATDTLVGNGTWADGSAFFGTSRTYGANTIANYVTTALSATTFNAAMAAMQAYHRHDNEPLEVMPNLLIVGPANEVTAWNLLKNKKVDTDNKSAENPNYGRAEYVVNRRLVGTYANYWFLTQTDQPIKGLAIQKRMESGLMAKDDPETSDHVFFHNEAVYATDARGAGALTVPHLLYGGYKSA